MSSRYDEGYDETEWGVGYHEEPEEDWRSRGYAEPEEEWRVRGNEDRYDHGYEHGYHGYDHGYDHGYEHGYNQAENHREEEEDDRGRSASYQYAEPEEESRVIADESLFRWLAVSYASTHLTMTHSYHGSCHGDTGGAGGLGIVNRAKWRPITGSK